MPERSEDIGGRYILGEQLGRGGMATVFRAHDPQFGRDVALKMLHALPGDEQEEFLVKKFQQEAKIIASLEHFAIVPVYDYGSHDGWPYLVMRLMYGGTLKDSIQQGPLPLAEIQIVLERICAALDRAHGRNVVHRDIKPTNIFMDGEGLVYLGDFGIARLTKGDQTTSYLGSPRYMAPEQAQGEPLGPATDIYQMGVVLFEMLTGEKPYSGASTEQTILMHLQAPIPKPTELNRDLPVGMDRLIQQAMAKNPADRFPSAGALADGFFHALQTPIANSLVDEVPEPDFDDYASPPTEKSPIPAVNKQPFFLENDPQNDSWGSQRQVPEQSFFQKNLTAIGAGFVAFLILLCGGGYFVARAAGVFEQLDNAQPVTIPAAPVLNDGGDGSVAEAEEVEQEELDESEEDGSDDPNPVETATLPPVERLLVDADEIGRLGGGSGRLVIAIEQENGFELFLSDGDGLNRLTDSGQDDFGPVFSPDGRQVAWHVQDPVQKTWEIFIANVDGTGQRNLTQNRADDSFPKWSADGSQIIFHSNRNDRQFDIFVINATGGEAIQLTNTVENELGPVFSPDGSRVAFHRRLSRTTSELFIMNPDGTGEAQVTTLNRPSEFASWSPDGQTLLFHAFVNGVWQVFTADIASGQATQLTFEGRDSFYPKWSPNGEWIIFHSEISELNRDLFMISKDGSERFRLTDTPQQERMPDWQP